MLVNVYSCRPATVLTKFPDRRLPWCMFRPAHLGHLMAPRHDAVAVPEQSGETILTRRGSVLGNVAPRGAIETSPAYSWPSCEGSQSKVQAVVSSSYGGCMSISTKTRKLLWARFGNQCAYCRCPHVMAASQSSEDAAVGDECHIVARRAAGRREPLAVRRVPPADRAGRSPLLGRL